MKKLKRLTPVACIDQSVTMLDGNGDSCIDNADTLDDKFYLCSDVDANLKIGADTIFKLSKKLAELEIQNEKDLTDAITERDQCEQKATELANLVGKIHGFDVGEHSNLNCPVQSAIEGISCHSSELEEENKRLKREYDDLYVRFEKLGNIIHYPACWDITAYPTLESVLFEIGCNPNDCSKQRK